MLIVTYTVFKPKPIINYPYYGFVVPLLMLCILHSLLLSSNEYLSSWRYKLMYSNLQMQQLTLAWFNQLFSTPWLQYISLRGIPNTTWCSDSIGVDNIVEPQVVAKHNPCKQAHLMKMMRWKN